MSLSALTALPRRLVSTTLHTAVHTATHPVATAARGVGLARGTASGLLHLARGDAPHAHRDRADAGGVGAPTAPGQGARTDDGALVEPAFEPVPYEPEPPAPRAVPTPDQARIAPASVVQPEPERGPAEGYQHTPEPEPEVVYTSETPEGADPGAGVDDGSVGDLLDPGTAHALQAEAETMAKAADPRFGD